MPSAFTTVPLPAGVSSPAVIRGRRRLTRGTGVRLGLPGSDWRRWLILRWIRQAAAQCGSTSGHVNSSEAYRGASKPWTVAGASRGACSPRRHQWQTGGAVCMCGERRAIFYRRLASAGGVSAASMQGKAIPVEERVSRLLGCGESNDGAGIGRAADRRVGARMPMHRVAARHDTPARRSTPWGIDARFQFETPIF
jgi:hypothetical protein